MRPALPTDSTAVEQLCRAAFPPEECDDVAALAATLLREPSEPEAVSLVTEREEGLSGYIGFSPLGLQDGTEFAAYLLGPLAVHPEAQGQGIGSRLVKAGLRRLEKDRIAMAFVYGDPAYYGRFGFDATCAAPYVVPYDLVYPFGWLALKLPGHGALPPGGTVTCVPPLQRPELW